MKDHDSFDIDSSVGRTLFDGEINDEFLKGLKGNKEKPVFSRTYASNYFCINQGDQKNPKYQFFFCELNDHYIFLRRKDYLDFIAYMDILNAIVRISKPVIINQEKYFGLKFIKRTSYEELFSPDENVISEWYEHLKKFCRQIKFKNRFNQITLLGKGSFAKVFLVERKEDKQRFAVKIFDKRPFMEDDDELKCLMYEIKMMKLMNHKKVLKLFEVFEGQHFLYLVCDYYQGKDLWTEIIEKGAQNELKALTVLQQLLEALVYLHGMKVIHRDVKPENILFRSTKNITELGLVDLGFATFEKDYNTLFVRCGTPGYVAPEVLEDKPYDCKADVFSAGVIFFLM